MNRYPEYKDSGVEWLEEVPAHWALTKLKHVTIVNPTKSSSDYDKASDEEVTFLPMENVSEDGVIDTSIRRPISELWSGFTYFEEGDAIVAKITPCFENGKGAHLQHLGSPIGFGSTEFHVLRPRPGVSNGRFLYYLTHSQVFRTPGEAFMTGAAGQKRVPTAFVEEFDVALPPVGEQSLVVDYLDRKTAQIETLIQKKQALIELLREQRTALINRAVTKGLDVDVPMKDSGIDWVGEVPEHWAVTRLKYLSPQVTVGIVVTPSAYYVEEGIPCLRSLNVREGGLVASDLVFISEESNEKLSKSKVYAGDLVAVRTGKPGTTAVVDRRFDGANCIDLLIVRQSPSFDSSFIAYAMNSQTSKVQYQTGSGGAIQQHFNVETAKDLLLAVPPVEEQREIAERIAGMAMKIEAIISREQRLCDLLAELRSALISEVVTGKIDVRESDIAVEESSGEGIAA